MAEFRFRNESDKYTVQDLYDIILRLRAPGGCPWDREQTHFSLIKPMIEEAYEAVDAIKNDDTANMVEEFGDVLLQVIFHSIIGAEEGRFTLDDISDRCTRKMISRHSHVFGDVVANDSESALANWEVMKKKEHGEMTLPEILDEIPKSFPAALKANKIAKKVRLSGEAAPVPSREGLDAEKEKLYDSGRELFELCTKLEAEGINAEEALAFYSDKLIKEAGNNETR